MALRQIKPALQYSEGRSKPWAGAKLVNAFAEKADGDKQQDFAVMAIPGLSVFAAVGTGPIRGTHTMGGSLFVVSGSDLYSVDSQGQTSLIGALPGQSFVQMADNGAELAVAADGIAYVVSEGLIVQPANLPAVTDVAYIDGYFIWSLRDSSQCMYSAIGDGTSYDPLDIISAEGLPGSIIGIIANHRELHIFKDASTEIFYNSGGSDNAFERQGNAFIERGCFDRDSIAKVDNSVQFLGDDKIVYRLDGYTPVRISTHAIEYRLSDCTFARSFSYTQEGHKFYGLTVDAGTFLYDLATGTWHERRSWDRDNYRVGHASALWGGTIFGDNVTSALYRPDFDVLTEAGDPIRVEIELPSLNAARARVTMYAFEAYFETGVGLNSGQGSDPQIMMTYSDDGGRTWSNELWRSLGAIGEYRTRAVWRSLGQFRQRAIRLVVTDPVRKFAIGYFADVR